MRKITIILILICSVIHYAQEINEIVIGSSFAVKNNIYRTPNLRELEFKILDLEYKNRYYSKNNMDLGLNIRSDLNHSTIFNDVNDKFNVEDQFFQRLNNHFEFESKYYLSNSFYMQVNLPFDYSLFSLQRSDSEISTKSKLDLEFKAVLDYRNKDFALYSGENNFEEGFQTSFYFKKGLNYTYDTEFLKRKELPLYFGLEFSNAHLVNKLDATIKYSLKYDTQLNEDFSYMFSDYEYYYYDWITFETFISCDFHRKLNINSMFGIKYGEYEKDNEYDAYSSEIIFIHFSELNYYIKPKIKLYGLFETSKLLFPEMNTQNDKVKVDSPDVLVRIGCEVFLDLKVIYE